MTDLEFFRERADRPRCIAVIDDDDSFRPAVVRMLEVCGRPAVGYRCAGEFLLSDGLNNTSCIILDMCMPGLSGLDFLDSMLHRSTAPPIVFVTGFGDVQTTVRAIKAGAVDFLTKPIDRERLLRAVDRAVAMDQQRRRAWRELQDLRARYAQLTPSERAVFAGVVSGQLNKQLAGALGVCERSIKSCRARVMRKLNALSLASLVKCAKLLGVDTAASSGTAKSNVFLIREPVRSRADARVSS
jgi:FixJ family two-component response regulator